MSIKYGIKRLFKPLAEFMRKVTYKLMRNVICDLEETIRFSSGGNENDYLIPYQEGELIRVLFLFQAASFWPAGRASISPARTIPASVWSSRCWTNYTATPRRC